MDDTATAHHAWDRRWTSDEGRADWLRPEDRVVAWAETARERGAERALDLGCGVGRHTLVLGRRGFAVDAIDGSESGVAYAREQATREGLAVDFRVGPMTDLPYADGAFDYVLAWNVIYHGDGAVVRRCLDEIRRVLRPGGLYQGTMLSKRNVNFGRGREVAPDTFVADEVGEKAHPHFYCNAAELLDLFGGFQPWIIEDLDLKRPGAQHWHIVMERG